MKKKKSISINEGSKLKTNNKLNTSLKKTTHDSKQTIRAVNIAKPKNVANLALTAVRRGGIRLNLDNEKE